MKKTICILLALLSPSLNADVEVKSYGDRYIYRYVQDGVVRCWDMPSYVDLSYFNTEWATVRQTAVEKNWPAPQPAAQSECTSTGVFKTYGGYFVNPLSGQPITTELPSGIPCGEQVSTFSLVRVVHWNDQIGMAICVKSR